MLSLALGRAGIFACSGDGMPVSFYLTMYGCQYHLVGLCVMTR